jgi:hypothetical protein
MLGIGIKESMHRRNARSCWWPSTDPLLARTPALIVAGDKIYNLPSSI